MKDGPFFSQEVFPGYKEYIMNHQLLLKEVWFGITRILYLEVIVLPILILYPGF